MVAILALALKYNPNHDKLGRFSSSGASKAPMMNPVQRYRMSIAEFRKVFVGEFYTGGGEYVGSLHRVAPKQYRVRTVNDGWISAESDIIDASSIASAGGMNISAARRVNHYKLK